MAGGSGLGRRGPEQAIQNEVEVGWRIGFAHKAVETGILPAILALAARCGNRDDRRALDRRIGADLVARLVAAHPRQSQIHQHHIGAQAARRRHRFRAVRYHMHDVTAVAQIALGDFCVPLHIVDHQHGQRRESIEIDRLLQRLRRGRLLRRQGHIRNLDHEHRTLARFAVDLDPPLHRVHQPARDAQAQAGAGAHPAIGRVGLMEGFEDARTLFGLDPDAAVPDDEAEIAQARIVTAAQCDTHRHPALLGVLHRIADQVHQDLPEPLRVEHQRAGRATLDLAGQEDALGGGLRIEQVDDFRQHFARIGRLWIQFQLAGFDLRQIEHVVDQRQQHLSALLDRGHPFALHRAGHRFRKQLGETEDRIHRRADLVAHVRQEDALLLAVSPRLRRLQLGHQKAFGLALRLPDREEAEQARDQREAVGYQHGGIGLLDQGVALFGPHRTQAVLFGQHLPENVAHPLDQSFAAAFAHALERRTLVAFAHGLAFDCPTSARAFGQLVVEYDRALEVLDLIGIIPGHRAEAVYRAHHLVEPGAVRDQVLGFAGDRVAQSVRLDVAEVGIETHDGGLDLIGVLDPINRFAERIDRPHRYQGSGDDQHEGHGQQAVVHPMPKLDASGTTHHAAPRCSRPAPSRARGRIRRSSARSCR